jgi:hypothetical protein
LLFDVIVTRQEFLQHAHALADVYKETWRRRADALQMRRQGNVNEAQQRGSTFAQLFSFSPGHDSNIQFVALFLEHPRLNGFRLVSQELPIVAPTGEVRQEDMDNAEIFGDRIYQIAASRLFDFDDNPEDEQEDDNGREPAASPADAEDTAEVNEV